MLISVHIPKTAGTTFRGLLEAHYGARLHLDYADRPLAPHYDWRMLKARLRGRGRPEWPSDCACIHGHFIANKYARLDAPAQLVTWLRDPVQRVASHYHYWKRVPDLGNPDCRRLIERRLALEDFAALPRMRNVESRFFGGKAPRVFYFIGLVEHMADSLSRFERLTGIATGARLPRTAMWPDRATITTCRLPHARASSG